MAMNAGRSCPAPPHPGPPWSSRTRRAELFRGAQGREVRDDQSPRAFVREYFRKQAVGGSVADDVHAAHAAANGILDRRLLGQHAVLEGALVAQALQTLDVRVGDHRAGIRYPLENPLRAGA